MNYYDFKRRIKNEWRGLKYLIKTKNAIRNITVVYEVGKIVYCPWAVFDLIYRYRYKLIAN